MGLNKQFWQNKRVLITGHTGFKGSWLCWCLLQSGAQVYGYALAPNTEPSLYQLSQLDNHLESCIGDIRDPVNFAEQLGRIKPDVVFHLAAQPLVRYSYDHPIETYATNVLGTVNVLEAVRRCQSVKVVVNITTDKCYENKEWYWGYREDDRLGGYDPYSNSKACAELVSQCYQNLLHNKTALATVRAGNVIGGGDWAMDRLIPDMVRALQRKETITLRNPLSIRPWQHVLEPLSGYMLLAERLWDNPAAYASAWNFGPCDNDCKTVGWLAQHFVSLWGQGTVTEEQQINPPHEATFLKLDISKAKSQLQWAPKLTIEDALSLTVDFYQAWLNKGNVQEILLRQIQSYFSLKCQHTREDELALLEND